MKRIIKSLGLGVLVLVGALMARPVEAQPRVGVSISFQTFYDALSPYGEWIDYPEYGYTWRPRVGANFRPYATNGYWIYTNDYEWMWYSDYEWGWAPFHYGRWFYDPFYGWLWVPGYDWAPAWVVWRGGGDYFGWAPLRPGISISIGIGTYNPPYDYWTFAPSRYMTSRYISGYYYPYRNNVTIINRTTIIHYHGNRGGRGGHYISGPRRTDVERYTGRIRPLSVRNSDRPGRASLSRNAVSVYRPTVERSSKATYAPRTVQRYDRSAIAPSQARNDGNNSRNTNRSELSRDRNVRVNTPPRREDAIQNRGAGGNNDIRSNNNRRITDNASRTRENNIGRTEQMQRQRVEHEQRAREARQRSEQERQARISEMRQRNEAAQQQQRAAEARQRSVQQQQQQRQAEAQIRAREVQAQRQSAPRVESRSQSRSFESRSSSSAPSRSAARSERSSRSDRRSR